MRVSGQPASQRSGAVVTTEVTEVKESGIDVKIVDTDLVAFIKRSELARDRGEVLCLNCDGGMMMNLQELQTIAHHQLPIKIIIFNNDGYLMIKHTQKALFAGRCQAYSADASALASVRNKEAPNPADYAVLPDLISKEPLGPVVRRGDDEWFAIVKWVIAGLIEAEEYGITAANIEQLKAETTDPVIGRIVGKADDTGKLLGLDRDWMVRAMVSEFHFDGARPRG